MTLNMITFIKKTNDTLHLRLKSTFLENFKTKNFYSDPQSRVLILINYIKQTHD